MGTLNSVAPPAFTPNPQFTPAYWDKAPRSKQKLKLLRMTKLEGGFTEFVFDDNSAFQRKTDSLDPEVILHANQVVYVETIQASLVTGLWVPEQGWAFRMTSEDLAEYARGLSELMHRRQVEAKNELAEFVHVALREGISNQVLLSAPDKAGRVILDGSLDLGELSQHVVNALSRARSAQG